MKQIELLTPADMLRKLYETADEETKGEMRERFPDIDFNAKDVFTFKNSQVLDTNCDRQGWAILVANFFAPEGLEMKCLVVNDAYVPEIFEHDGRRFIKFTRN